MSMVGLPDMPGTWPTIFFRSVTGGMRGLKKHRVKTASGDRGAINIWYDDNGMWRGERMVHFLTVSEITAKRSVDLQGWLKSNLPLIHGD